MDLLDDARTLLPDLVALRRDLHRDPETGLELPRTQERVMAELEGLGLEISTGSGTTSVTAVLRGGAGEGETVLLRGDMDALPVAEASGEEFSSENGNMHACGHDLHTSALVGAARLLSSQREKLAGDVVFMFQPGEEGWDGARVMVEEGVLDAAGRRVDHAYGLHVLSGIVPAPTLTSRAGTFFAACHDLDVTVRGVGGHGSSPHSARDPIPAAAEMITALQTSVTRRFDVFDPVVITVGLVRAGSRRNVIPDTASFEATIRSVSQRTAALLPEVIDEVCRGIAAAHGVDVEVDFRDLYPATRNAAEEVDFAREVAAELFSDERWIESPTPMMVSEDFSRVLDEVPGAFLALGACPSDVDPQRAPMNHSPLARFDDAVIADAAALHAGLAVTRLASLR
ncbi:M20 metallopeptidase family protein [Pseudonocardia endophytica]|uniref:Hippurate hydrolase n=1 Tax=Pseudonocardia endophytica TaxID=401976 RepID=A0A4R1HJN4_PSEEN|nr:M20 family metallopeptidase [Pseudonocardia endophytica]TCK22537.1 hippurate hydrolase [Pseudonocardia endophytica]